MTTDLAPERASRGAVSQRLRQLPGDARRLTEQQDGRALTLLGKGEGGGRVPQWGNDGYAGAIARRSARSRRGTVRLLPRIGSRLTVGIAGGGVDGEFLVHHEATFDRDELRRHLTVLVLTPTRLVVGHTDDHPPDEISSSPHATTSTESVRIDRIDSVVVSRVVDDPAKHPVSEVPREVVLTLGWGAISRLDLEPAVCADPECEADHGYTGTATLDDFSVRVSQAADGVDGVTGCVGVCPGGVLGNCDQLGRYSGFRDPNKISSQLGTAARRLRAGEVVSGTVCLRLRFAASMAFSRGVGMGAVGRVRVTAAAGPAWSSGSSSTASLYRACGIDLLRQPSAYVWTLNARS